MSKVLSNKAMSLMAASHTVHDKISWDALWDYIAELEAAQGRWVMASERLPEENQQILSTDGKEFYLDYYARWEGKDNPPCFCDGLSWAVTHWMPLPEYPNDTQTDTVVYGKEGEE